MNELYNAIKVLYEDDHYLILDKPWGLIVNNSTTAGQLTVQNYLLETKVVFQTEGVEQDDPFIERTGIAHRIDKDTSGILVVTKDVNTFRYMLREFKRHKIKKKYSAVVLGELTDSKIQVNAPIIRDPHNRLRYAIAQKGKESITTITKLKTGVGKVTGMKYTHIMVEPVTGRTHQIRIHCAALNLPIACDPIYMTSKQLKDGTGDFDRLMLHAYQISFKHPTTKKELIVVSELPKEFVEFDATCSEA